MDKPNAAFNRNHIGIAAGSEAPRRFWTRPAYEKRCRRHALPPQSKSLLSGREVAGFYYGSSENKTADLSD
jgi:hypothetical protein